MTATPAPGLNSKLSIFKVYFNQQTMAANVTLMKTIGANELGISPFFLRSFSLHEDLPLLFLGINWHGIVVLHLFSYEVVFVVDLYKYMI